jgi:hypothetical protein
MGNRNALRHGHYTAEAIARRGQLSELIRATRTTLAKIEEQWRSLAEVTNLTSPTRRALGRDFR